MAATFRGTSVPLVALGRLFAFRPRCVSSKWTAQPLRTSILIRQARLRQYHAGVGSGQYNSDPKKLVSQTNLDLTAPLPPTAPSRSSSRLRRAVSFGAYALLFTTLGFSAAAIPLVPGILDLTRPRSDEDSLREYAPVNAEAKTVDDFINNHPLAAEMRRNPEMTESRPHMRLPDSLRRHNLTGGTLLGPGRITVPPVCWTEKGGKSLLSISHLGTDMCGHPGIVHGGLLATMLDEGLARCCFGALPHNVGVTAKLEINYRKPVHAGQYVVLRARTLRVEGRKAWVEGQLETLAAEGEEPVVLAQATALFVSPRFASVMAKLNATS
ncbi:thioesterase superfamily protein [Colletotrichum musicola]|uniref:Thioesterase superfamily protein n=1 Tax=Colletotrichum musicola TaxID=2175873 RepID=A0A8H6NXL9_9PEZI|nr:thioesterase superfamily protein [Colletotrichum musicola]